MNFTSLTKAAIASTMFITSLSSAFAYSIHYKDGKYSVICENGDKWTRGNGSQQITHADAANICAKRGSSLIAPDGAKPGAAKKAPSGFSKVN
ncbi:MAG: hypothetical protein WBA42_23670 [Mesorhizobium sp.]|jgi:hypothetical protein